jgi:hypothetical protein
MGTITILFRSSWVNYIIYNGDLVTISLIEYVELLISGELQW